MNKTRNSKKVIGFLLAILILAACTQTTPTTTRTRVPPTSVPASEPAPLHGSVLEGGRLYDLWWEEAGIEAPSGDHPLWSEQSSNTRSGETTWRCKECHGWDYLGEEGAYGSGSHYTGFPGVFNVRGLTQSELMAWLDGSNNPDHDFSMMGHESLEHITAFIKEGLVYLPPVIDDQSKTAASGDKTNGATLYEGTCSQCHGEDGRQVNFGSPLEPEYIGTIARDNPWEFIHKVRIGQPGTEMPASVELGWGMQNVLDVLVYTQSLPVDSPQVGSIARGGRLFDTWWEEAGLDEPLGDNPLWERQSANTRTGSTTWRCKECHGWDYLGVDGVYGSGSHQTGFPGILDSQLIPPQALTSQIKGQADPDHNFSMLNEEAIADLVTFIREGLIDMRPLIDAQTGSPINGEAVRGSELYEASCAMCHGEEGRSLNFGDEENPEYVGTIAVDNPWEFIHKVRAGQPGTAMPAMIDAGWSLQELLDLLAYSQTLPASLP